MAQVIHEYLKLPLGMSVALIDGLVIVGALLVFDGEVVMYSIISLFVISRTIDVVQVGFVKKLFWRNYYRYFGAMQYVAYSKNGVFYSYAKTCRSGYRAD